MSLQAAPEVDSRVVSAPQRVGVKIFVEDQEAFDRNRMIAVFHKWIQEERIPGTLIDVHDYTHVREGPGVVLIAHEWHLRTDEAGGRIGLEYELKREATGTLAERLREATVSALEAAAALEQDTAEENPVRFATNELVFRFTDRLAVPTTEAALEEVAGELQNLLTAFYGGATIEVERVGHARGPLTLHTRVVGDGEWSLEDLVSGARSAAG
jgi:hypothetical protein